MTGARCAKANQGFASQAPLSSHQTAAQFASPCLVLRYLTNREPVVLISFAAALSHRCAARRLGYSSLRLAPEAAWLAVEQRTKESGLSTASQVNDARDGLPEAPT